MFLFCANLNCATFCSLLYSEIPLKYCLSLNMTVISSPPELHDTGENIYHFYWLASSGEHLDWVSINHGVLWTSGEGVHQPNGISVLGRGQPQVKLISLQLPVSEDGTRWPPAQLWQLLRLREILQGVTKKLTFVLGGCSILNFENWVNILGQEDFRTPINFESSPKFSLPLPLKQR